MDVWDEVQNEPHNEHQNDREHEEPNDSLGGIGAVGKEAREDAQLLDQRNHEDHDD